jgi:hypothetical protein
VKFCTCKISYRVAKQIREFFKSQLSIFFIIGRLIWQNYLGSGPAVMSSILNVIRTRTGIPAAPVKEEPVLEIYNENFKPLHMDSLPADIEPGENLGPLEPPIASPAFRFDLFLYSLIICF